MIFSFRTSTAHSWLTARYNFAIVPSTKLRIPERMVGHIRANRLTPDLLAVCPPNFEGESTLTAKLAMVEQRIRGTIAEYRGGRRIFMLISA